MFAGCLNGAGQLLMRQLLTQHVPAVVLIAAMSLHRRPLLHTVAASSAAAAASQASVLLGPLRTLVSQTGLKPTMLLSHCPQACLLSRTPAPCLLHMVAASSVAAVASQMSVLLGPPWPLAVVPQAALSSTMLLNHCSQAHLSSRGVAPCLLPTSQQLPAVQPGHCMHFCTCPFSHPAPLHQVHAMFFYRAQQSFWLFPQPLHQMSNYVICAPLFASSLLLTHA